MPEALLRTWGGSLHQSFRLLPVDRQTPNLKAFLEAEGLTEEELLARLPFDEARSSRVDADGPDRKRYRDPRQVYQTAGMLHEGDDGRVHLTPLGHAVRRWLPLINTKNRVILARHVAYALAACQLRNPTRAGLKYDPTVRVFPFAFIWRAMLALDDRISSDELNRSLFKVTSEDELAAAIVNIRNARLAGDVTVLGDEDIQGRSKNDRIIPWMALASFGWSIFPDKRDGGGGTYYQLAFDTKRVVIEATKVGHRHRDFGSVAEYVEYIAACASLPRDLR